MAMYEICVKFVFRFCMFYNMNFGFAKWKSWRIKIIENTRNPFAWYSTLKTSFQTIFWNDKCFYPSNYLIISILIYRLWNLYLWKLRYINYVFFIAPSAKLLCILQSDIFSLRWALHTLQSDNFLLRWVLRILQSDNFTLRWALRILWSDYFSLRWVLRILWSDYFLLCQALRILGSDWKWEKNQIK